MKVKKQSVKKTTDKELYNQKNFAENGKYDAEYKKLKKKKLAKLLSFSEYGDDWNDEIDYDQSNEGGE